MSSHKHMTLLDWELRSKVGPFRYFTDPKVLDRIPFMFLLLGGVSLTMEIIAVCVLREPTEEEVMEIKASTCLKFHVSLTQLAELVQYSIVRTNPTYCSLGMYCKTSPQPMASSLTVYQPGKPSPAVSSGQNGGLSYACPYSWAFSEATRRRMDRDTTQYTSRLLPYHFF